VTVALVRIEGGYRDRGRAAGRALGERIHRSLAFYRGFLERRGVAPGDLPRLLGPYRDAGRDGFPELFEEIEGTAEGAEVPVWDLLAANAWEELEPMLARTPVASDRCTSFAITGPQGTLLAHNEQWYAGDAGNTAVVVSEPEDGPAFASPTVVACLPAVGMNAAGLAQGVMSLSARTDGPGVPRVPVSSAALRAPHREELVRRATVPGRSGGYAYVVAETGRPFTLETSATGHAVLDVTAHTNHYLSPDLAPDGEVSDGSVSRLDRLRTLLDDHRPATPQEAMDLLRDHHGDPQQICVHPDPSSGDEAVGVLFSMVCHVEDRRMWVADGNPCTAPFEEIDLAGALG
jgi:isopenicillin-N N-acyltransferase-like protein